MREQLLAERTTILAELTSIEVAIAELLGAGMGKGAERRLAELIHIHKVATRGRLKARLAIIDAILRGSDDT